MILTLGTDLGKNIRSIKGSTVVSLITISDLSFATTIIRKNTGLTFEPVTLVGVMFLITSIPIAIAARYLEERVARRLTR